MLIVCIMLRRYLLYEYYNAAPEQSKDEEDEDSQPSYIQPTLWPLHSSYGGNEDLLTPTRTSSFFSVTERRGGSPRDFESPENLGNSSKWRNYRTMGGQRIGSKSPKRIPPSVL